MHARGHSPLDKTKERITFSLIYTPLYLTESYDEQYDNYAAANTFNICCGGGVSRSSLIAITVFLSDTSDVVYCWIFTSARFLTNDPLSSDDMVDWDNDSMMGIGGEDTNIDEGSFVLNNIMP